VVARWMVVDSSTGSVDRSERGGNGRGRVTAAIFCGLLLARRHVRFPLTHEQCQLKRTMLLRMVARRGVARRGFFTSKPVRPPELLVVGAEAMLGYNPTNRAEHLKAGEPALAVVPTEVVTSALAFIDENVSAAAIATGLDYTDALNAAIMTLAEANAKATRVPISKQQLEKIAGVPMAAHVAAIRAPLKLSTALHDVLQTIRGNHKHGCKLAFAADGGPLFQVSAYTCTYSSGCDQQSCILRAGFCIPCGRIVVAVLQACSPPQLKQQPTLAR
jgi:hypothetical protein